MVSLELSGVHRSYGSRSEVRALDGVDLVVQEGEYIAITGDSGSGKSTLLGVLGLLDEPSSGDYRIDRISSRQLRHRARARSDYFAHIFQAFHLLERRPAIDSVGLPLLYRGLSHPEIREASFAALAQLGLREFAEVKGGLLSGGQRQRVAISRALAAQTPVLLADEPTGNLDSTNSAAVMEAMNHVHRSGATVVVVTHSDEAASRAQRVIRMRDGRIVSESIQSGFTVAEVQAPTPGGKASTVRVGPMLRDVVDNLRSRPARAVGLVSAVAVAVGLVVATLGLSFSASQQVSGLFDVATSREVSITQLVGTDAATRSEEELDRLANLNGVLAVADVIENEGAIQRGDGRETVVAPWFHARGDVVEAGRLVLSGGSEPWEGSLSPNTALIGQALATRLEIAAVDASPSILVNGTPYEIVGVIAETPRQAEWIGGVLTLPPSTPLPGLHENKTLLTTAAGAGQQVAREVPLAANPFAPEKVAVSVPPDSTAMRTGIESSLQTTLFVLTTAALLGSVASLALASISAAAERRSEFGLRRALGARSIHIGCMLTAEATVTGMAGALSGLLGGLVSILAVTIANRWTPVFDFRLAILALLAGVAVSVVGSLAGAIRALQVQPSAALKPSH